jgi:GT2 family glycosyltransferase
VFVVDNASNDGTVELVREHFEDVTRLANDRNEGFAAAANRGIRAKSAEYALVLNPDTRVTAGALDPLLALIDERPDVGICGCRLERHTGAPS